jgi:hypothetical protein
LVCSFLHLYKSPWNSTSWQLGKLHASRGQDRDARHERWKLHLACPLIANNYPENNTNRSIDESVVAFGLLLVQMQAKEIAAPSNEDYDWFEKRPTNASKLIRLLKRWKGRLRRGDRIIAKACLEFPDYVRRLDMPNLDSELRPVATIYRYIASRLLAQVNIDFGHEVELFLATPEELQRARQATTTLNATGLPALRFFDDDESGDHNIQ